MPDEPQSQADEGSESQVDSTSKANVVYNNDRDGIRVQETTKSQADTDDALQKELASVRREAAKYRVKLKEIEDSKLSESEKQQQRLKELEGALAERDNRLTELTVSQVLQGAVAEAGVVINPQLAARLIDRSVLEVSEDGVPTDRSVQRAIKSLKETEPNLFGTQSSWDGGVRTSAPAETSMNDLLQRARR